jgi:hypothetical protein
MVSAPTSNLTNALGNFSGWMMKGAEIVSLQHMAFLQLWKANGKYASTEYHEHT